MLTNNSLSYSLYNIEVYRLWLYGASFSGDNVGKFHSFSFSLFPPVLIYIQQSQNVQSFDPSGST